MIFSVIAMCTETISGSMALKHVNNTDRKSVV